MEFLDCLAKCIQRGPSSYGTLLENNGQSDGLFFLHFPEISGQLGVFGPQVFFSLQIGYTGQSQSGTLYHLVSGWWAESCSLLEGAILGMSVLVRFICNVGQRPNFLPPFQEPIVLLQEGTYPHAGIVRVIFGVHFFASTVYGSHYKNHLLF